MKNFTLVSGSSSHFTSPSSVHVADGLHWWLQNNATLVIDEDVHLFANRPSDYTGQPCLHVEGRLIWNGRSGHKSTSTLEIMNRNEVVVQTREDEGVQKDNPTPFEVLLYGGLTSLSHSRLTIFQSTLLSSSCHPNMTSLFGCTFGRVVGSGSLELSIGQHTFQSTLNLTHLILKNGKNEFFQNGVFEKIEMNDGEMRIHRYIFVKQVSKFSHALRHAHTHARTRPSFLTYVPLSLPLSLFLLLLVGSSRWSSDRFSNS